jgi:hypothetical protein
MNETLNLVLSNPVDGIIGDGTGVGTIINDDAVITIDDVTLSEGTSGTKNFIFTISMSPASSQPVTVTYTTSDNTAFAGSDYVAKSGTIVFAPGETSKTWKLS